MVAMETTTVMKILISIFGEYFQVALGCKVWSWSDKRRKCYQELKFSGFFVSDHLKPGFHKANDDHDNDQIRVKTKRLAWRMTAQPYNRFVLSRGHGICRVMETRP